ncbi:MAG TPA: YqaA family protein [Acidobacteriota bacterium]|nr:YqaA family protein [Acidobacteriota bacterium]
MKWIRRIYDWVLSFAQSPYGTWALLGLAFSEASFFPVPPDVLLIALAVGAPNRALFFALVTTAGSVLGAGIGYWIGYQFFELLGQPIIDFYQMHAQFSSVQQLYQHYDALAVGIAGFTPIPFKVFTLAAGVFHLNLPTFFAASLVSRGLRFFLIGLLILYFGPQIQRFIDRYFNLLAILFTVLLVGGFLLIKYAIK